MYFSYNWQGEIGRLVKKGVCAPKIDGVLAVLVKCVVVQPRNSGVTEVVEFAKSRLMKGLRVG